MHIWLLKAVGLTQECIKLQTCSCEDDTLSTTVEQNKLPWYTHTRVLLRKCETRLTTNRRAAGAEAKWPPPGERASSGTGRQYPATAALQTWQRSRWSWQPWDDGEGRRAPALRERQERRGKTEVKTQPRLNKYIRAKSIAFPIRTRTPYKAVSSIRKCSTTIEKTTRWITLQGDKVTFDLWMSNCERVEL